MAKRRTLAEGLKNRTDGLSEKEKKFVFGEKESGNQSPPEDEAPWEDAVKSSPEGRQGKRAIHERPMEAPVGRSPFTTRLRADIAASLKRASLEQQLKGQSPSAVQDILDEALERWLKSHGYHK